MKITEKLSKLREKMKESGADFFFVPSSDAHRNEYVPQKWQRRAWISGFTGSAGDALIGKKEAWLWTDGRYTQQAKQELNLNEFTLAEYSQGAAPAVDVWLAKQEKGTVFAVDPSTITSSQAKRFAKVLEEIGGRLLYVSPNWIDELCVETPEAIQPLRIFPLTHAGASTKEKLKDIRNAMKAERADALLLNTLDEIAWVFNLRGNDLPYNPFFISYALITTNKATLFVDLKKVTPEIQKYLDSFGVNIEAYGNFERTLLKLKGRVWMDPFSANAWMYGLVSHAHRILAPTPIALMKAVKNSVELEGAKQAHVKDAVSMVRFMRWLSVNWSGQSEVSVAKVLESFRKEDPTCLDLSFATIAGMGSNGSIIHYHATESTDQKLTDTSLFLLDSGAQYLEGTTDITRVFHFGTPTQEQKTWYTRVLKGHLSLRRAIFCHGARGEHLDILARSFLWEVFANYGHGTGHGVGAYLCVHEGPQRISMAATTAPILPGMIVSNEPGVYFEGKWGVRIENLIYTVEKASAEMSPSGHGPFYGFEDLTLVPYERDLIDLSLLTSQEIEQINAYHAKIFDQLSEKLEEADRAYLAEKVKSLQ